MNKKLLFLSPFFYPEPISTGKYNSFLARSIVESGKDVIVGCSHPLYPDWKPSISTESFKGAEIIRGGSCIKYPRSAMARRLVLELWFTLHAISVVLKVRKKIDSIVVVFPPSLFFCLIRLVLPSNVRRIGIVHDLQGILGLTGGGLAKRILSKIVTYVEKAGFSACDKLVLLSEAMKRNVVCGYGIDPNKCLVHYPFVTEAIDNDNKMRNVLEKCLPVNFKHVIYSGALGEKQDPENLLGMFTKLVATRKDIVCHIFSRGPLFEQLQCALPPDIKDRILFHDLVDEADLPELFARSTVQVIPQKVGTSGGAFPSKLPNLLASGVPVFAVTDEGSELSKLLAESGIGVCRHSWELDSVVATLSSFVDQVSQSSNFERATKIKSFVNKYFNVDNLVKELEAV
ncbi:MAG: glycosyltransferase family 4 protein [Geopsychrobacter sp.]|nr:glycosyltransferase family 4 protein [Geopsychrobacter sp.]